MRIEAIQMYKMFFNYEGTELMVPVSAASVEEAKRKLSGLFLKWSTEIGESPQPTLSPVQLRNVEVPTVPPYALELRIEELLKDIVTDGKRKPKKDVSQTVREWTGFPMEEQNYLSIISELERIKRDEKAN